MVDTANLWESFKIPKQAMLQTMPKHLHIANFYTEFNSKRHLIE